MLAYLSASLFAVLALIFSTLQNAACPQDLMCYVQGSFRVAWLLGCCGTIQISISARLVSDSGAFGKFLKSAR